MNPSSQFEVSIPNLDKLQAALKAYPAIALPILQKAIMGSQAILAKHKVRPIVPFRQGYLLTYWDFRVGTLQAAYSPRATYAPYVEFGTQPHDIAVKNRSVLAGKPGANWSGPVSKSGYAIFGKLVHHPGTKANPFMERIVEASQPEITALFGKALEKITAAIASQASL
ncbi:MAG TPA: hypothetical protein VNJ52_05005 [Patescibacteria group bacterium]|nr:hypothetical protein [Patescibacteria group bacterium]